MNRTYLGFVNVERTGTSLHVWVGPLGVHAFRSTRTFPLALDWVWGIWR